MASSDYSRTWTEMHRKENFREAFEGQSEDEFPYPIDAEDKQGELEFYDIVERDAGVLEFASDMMADGETYLVGDFLSFMGEALSNPNNTLDQPGAIKAAILAAVKPHAKEYAQDVFGEDAYIKEAGDAEMLSALRYMLKAVLEELK